MRMQPTPIESILHLCVSGMLEKNQSLDDCLAQYPAQRAELEPLLKLTLRLQAASSLQASSDFRISAPIRMKNLIASHPRAKVAARRPPAAAIAGPLAAWLPGIFRQARLSTLRLGLVCLSVLLLFFLSMTTFQASAQALPGDRLYPFKTSLENMRLRLSWHDFQAAKLHLEFATTRIREAEQLKEINCVSKIVQPLQGYNIEIAALNRYYQPASSLTVEEQALLAEQILSMIEAQERLLEQWLPSAAPETQHVLQETIAQIQQLHQSLLRFLQAFPNHPIHLTMTPPATSQAPASTPTPPTQDLPSWWLTKIPNILETAAPTINLPTPFPWEIWKWPTWYAKPPEATYLPPPLPTNWQEYLPTYLPTHWPELINTPAPPTPPLSWPTEWEAFPTVAWPTSIPQDSGDPVPTPWAPSIPPPKPPVILPPDLPFP